MQFSQVVTDYPESALSRFYLALAYLNLEQMRKP